MSTATKTTVSVPPAMGARAKRLRDKFGNSHSLQRLMIRGLGMVLDAELPKRTAKPVKKTSAVSRRASATKKHAKRSK